MQIHFNRSILENNATIMITGTFDINSSEAEGNTGLPTTTIGTSSDGGVVKYALHRLFSIHSPHIAYTGKITQAQGNLAGWEIGFVQNLYEESREAIYKQGSIRRRQCPDNLPVRDGENTDGYVWASTNSDSLKELATGVQVEDSDEPNEQFPYKFVGSVTSQNVKKLYSSVGTAQHELTGIRGIDRFQTFLVIVKEQNKSIVILAAAEWIINWDGTYNADKTFTFANQNIVTFSPISPNPYQWLNQKGKAALQNCCFSVEKLCTEENYQVELDDTGWQFIEIKESSFEMKIIQAPSQDTPWIQS